MTLSISALCPESGQLGIAISSSSIAVGARCPWLLAGVGAVSSQNITLPALGPQILAGLEAGLTPQQALTQALGEDRFSDYRQVAVIDASGESAVFSGEHTLGIWQLAQGENCVAAGNMLANPQVITAMTAAFEAASGELASRLIAALQAVSMRAAKPGRSTRRLLKSWRITPGQWWIYASTGRKNAR